MSMLTRRLHRLEQTHPPASPWDAMDPILAEMSTPELIDLVQYSTAVRDGRQPTAEQDAVHRAFWDRLALVGIALP